MPRYIDAEKTKKLLTNAFCDKMIASKTQGNEVQKYIAEGINYSLNLINDEVPTADVQEVKHGKWTTGQEPSGSVYAHCSACNRKMNSYCYGYAFCPLCGARMDGEEK